MKIPQQYLGPWMVSDAFAGWIGGIVEAMNLDPSAAGSPTEGDSPRGSRGNRGDGYGYEIDANGIVTVQLLGALMPAESSLTTSTSTALLRRDARSMMADRDVRGVMLEINSPGGAVSGMFELVDDLRRLATAKPMAAYVTGLAASAAYAAAVTAPTISAYRSAQVGSIGTRTYVVDSSRQSERMGIRVIPIDSGGMKSAGLAGTPVTDEQVAYFQKTINDLQQIFTAEVAAGRNRTVDLVAQHWADGRVHVAAAGQQMGLIDYVESYDDAYARLAGRTQTQSVRSVGNRAVSVARIALPSGTRAMLRHRA